MMEPAKDRMRSNTNSHIAVLSCLMVKPCSWSSTISSLASSMRGLSVYSAKAAAGLGSTENCKDISLSD